MLLSFILSVERMILRRKVAIDHAHHKHLQKRETEGEKIREKWK